MNTLAIGVSLPVLKARKPIGKDARNPATIIPEADNPASWSE